MKDIAGDLAEHHHKWHIGNLKIGNEVQVRGNRAEQIDPPEAWRREEQGRQKDGRGRPHRSDARGRKPQIDSDNAPSVVARQDYGHAQCDSVQIAVPSAKPTNPRSWLVTRSKMKVASSTAPRQE